MPEKKKSVVPRLRFPEFRDAGEWEVKNFYDLLEDVLDFRGRTPKKLGMDWGGGNIVSLSANNVKNGYIDYGAECKLGSEDLYEKWMGKVSLEKGDIVFTTEAPLGNALLVPDSQKYILSQRVVAFKIKKEVNNAFIVQLIWSSQFQNKLKMLSTGSTAKGINQKTLKKVRVKIPQKKVEQQKIADCLSSLDEVIDLQTQNLDALKAHKKGLMQQLFPREGETTPRLRFPEFRDAGEWEVKQLKHISPAIFDGTHQTPNYTEKGVPFFSVENIVSGNKNKYISREDYIITTIKNKPEKGDIIITRIGNIGFSKVVDWDYEFSIYVTLAVVKKSELFNSQYLHYYFQSEYYQKEILSKSLLSAIPCKINMDELQKTKVLLPSLPEQQKIADCLSSLDEVINLQTQKLDTLKAHKKGLMQQFFPREVG